MPKRIDRFRIGIIVGSFATVASLYLMQAVVIGDASPWIENSEDQTFDFLHLIGDSETSESTRKVSTPETVTSGRPNQDVNLEIDHETKIQDGDPLPLVKVEPRYPRRAIARGIEGYVKLEFTVSEKGTVEDPVVIDSEPAGVFDRAAIQAALQFKYRPKIVDGIAVSTSGVKYSIAFELDDNLKISDEHDGVYLPLVKVEPLYPKQALKDGIEGYVVLEFTVSEDGAVLDPVIIESGPDDIFDRAAIQAALKFKYKPRIVDGAAVPTPGVKHRIAFELDDKSTINDEHEGLYLPLVKVEPLYPKQALKDGIEGSVVLEFTVSEDGAVLDPVIIEPGPDDIFDRAAIQAALKFKYKPRIVDGTAVPTPGVKHRISFEIDEEQDGAYFPLVKVQPLYPMQALHEGIEGYVVLEFTVTETGSVINPMVVDSTPSGIFDRSAIQAALKFRFKPKMVDGVPVQLSGVKHRFRFQLEK